MAGKVMPPQSGRSEFFFGLILPAMSRHKRAVAYACFMAWCIVFYPKHEGIQLERAYRLALKGRYTKALAVAERICRYANASAHSHAMRHVLLLRLDRKCDALKAIERAVEIDAESAEFHTYKGRLLLQDGHDGEAEQAFRAALNIDSRDSYARSHLACTLERSGRLDEAPWLARHLSKVDIEDDDLFFKRASAHVKICALKVTADRMKRNIKHNPRNRSARDLLNYVLKEVDLQKKQMN